MYPTSPPDTTGSSTPSPNRRTRSGLGWTDDLPECQLSDVGFAPNVVYLADGRTTEAYPYEDRAFNFALVYLLSISVNDLIFCTPCTIHGGSTQLLTFLFRPVAVIIFHGID